MGKDLKGKELGTGIIQKKDGRYEARFINRFGKRQSFTGYDLKDVKKRYNEAFYENEKEINIKEDMTLDSWYTQWMMNYKKDCLRENSIVYYKRIYEKHIKPVFGNRKLNDIKQIEINALIKELKKQGYRFETMNKVKILLIDMYNKAMINEIANKNPAKGTYVGQNDKKDPRALTEEEQMLFFERSKGSFYDNLFVVAVQTGLRIGEIAALRWKDIDLENKVIKVTRTLVYAKYDGDKQKTFHFENPKTLTSVRNVPINKQCEIALKKQFIQKKVVGNKKPVTRKVDEEFQDLLFTTSYDTPIESQIMKQAIGVIVADINLTRDYIEEIAPFSMHTLRHTFATRCFEVGIKPKTIQGYLGHATLAMTMDLYARLLPEYMQDEMEKLDMALAETDSDIEKFVNETFEKHISEDKKIINFEIA